MARNSLKDAVKRALDELKSGPIIRAELEKICEKTLSEIKMDNIVKRLDSARLGPKAIRRLNLTSDSFWAIQEKGLVTTIAGIYNDRRKEDHLDQ